MSPRGGMICSRSPVGCPRQVVASHLSVYAVLINDADEWWSIPLFIDRCDLGETMPATIIASLVEVPFPSAATSSNEVVDINHSHSHFFLLSALKLSLTN